jgi:hypothetical protein
MAPGVLPFGSFHKSWPLLQQVQFAIRLLLRGNHDVLAIGVSESPGVQQRYPVSRRSRRSRESVQLARPKVTAIRLDGNNPRLSN